MYQIRLGHRWQSPRTICVENSRAKWFRGRYPLDPGEATTVKNGWPGGSWQRQEYAAEFPRYGIAEIALSQHGG
jgi:hypothetical protein